MKLRSNPFAAISIALLSATTLHAATLYWDGTDTTAAVPDANGGAGTWDTTLTNWNDAATAGSAVAWPSTGIDNDAVFGGTAGIVTVDAGGVTANDLTFSTASYEIAGGTLTLNGAPVITNAVAATISASLSGTSGFTKSGVGTLTLSGTNTGLSGTLTLNTATGAANAGVNLSGADADGSLTQINVNGGSGSGSYLGLSNASLASGLTVNLTGQGGNSTPGTLRGVGGVSEVNGPVNINDGSVRISSFGGTSLTLNGVVTASATNPCYIRFGQNQGVIFKNTSNSWSGTTNLGEGSVYFYPNTLPSTSPLFIGSSNPADFGTNGSFTRALGIAAGEVQVGRSNDGQRAIGFSARGGALTVNLGDAAGDVVFLNTFAKTGATNATTTVTVDITNLLVGMSVTGSGIPTDTLISAIGTTTITLNKAATTTVASNALTFYAAANNARLNSSILVLNGGNADSALTFQNPLDLNGFNRFLQVSANTATITGGLKNSSATAAAARKTGAGTLIHDPGAAHTLTLAGLNTNAGTLELKSGTITVSGTAGTTAPDSSTGFVVSRGGTFRLNGGNVTATSGTYIFPAGNTGGGNSKFILDSGKFDANGREVLNAYGADGSTTINGGLFICQGFKVSQSTTGILNLNGGTLRTVYLYNGGSTVNFNGGTLQARAARADFIATSVTTAQIQSGGAVIDSNGFAITIPKVLTEDSGSAGGGLTKIGAGELTLTAANSYTGPTNVQVGSLLVNGDHTLATGAANVDANAGLGGDGIIGAVSYDDGAKFPWTVADWTAAPSLSAGAVTIDGALTVVVDDSLPAAPVTNFTDATTTFTILSASLLTVTNPSLLTVDSTAFTSGSGTWTVQKNGNTLELVYTAAAASPFTTWGTTTNGLAGGDATATADPDNDGLDNAVEFVIGGQPNPANPNANSSALAPTVSTDANNLIFTFRRTDLSLTQPGIGIAAEYGSDLVGWTPATNGVNGVAIVVTNDIETGVDQVQVSIPKTLGTGAKMFARLNVVIP